MINFVVSYCVEIANAKHIKPLRVVSIRKQGFKAENLVLTDSLHPEIGAETPAAIRWEEGGEVMSLSLREAREMFERQYLKAQVSRFGGNVSKTAEFVGMERAALHRKLKILGISLSLIHI